jgi:signal transduction histidine kinase
MLDIAFGNIERLTLLINDLLDIEKSKSGEFGLQIKPLIIGDLINKALSVNQGYAGKYDIQLAWQPSEDDKVTVNGDENRLLQVLSNLISNAIKYSQAGSEVQIATACHTDMVRISVTDTGPGIPIEFQDRVFEKFTQADSSDTRAKGGTGLGLAISKEIVERHNGHIGFESTPGQGTTFYFELAIARTKSD